jgi:hypothetical protein
MAGEWWAERLDQRHADKREAFAEAVARRCEDVLRACPDGRRECLLRVDYDPHGSMLLAVKDAIDPNCSGFGFSADSILPYKHSLRVTPGLLYPKEGYGILTSPIVVPAVKGLSDEQELRLLRTIAAAAERSVLNPAWAGVCDEDVDLEMALRAGGYLASRKTVDRPVTTR